MNIFEWLPLLGAATALVGATAGITNLYLSRRDKSAKVKVEVETKLRVSGSQVSDPFFTIIAKNFGENQVRICGAEVILPEGKQIPLTPDTIFGKSFPTVLEPGGQVSVAILYTDLARTLGLNGYKGKVSFRGRYRDELGRTFLSKSKSWPFEEWLHRKVYT